MTRPRAPKVRNPDHIATIERFRDVNQTAYWCTETGDVFYAMYGGKPSYCPYCGDDIVVEDD